MYLDRDDVGMFFGCSDGGDAVTYQVMTMTSSYAQVNESPGEGCLVPGDEFLLINVLGTESAYANVGNYEFIRVGAVNEDQIVFASVKQNYYGNAYNSDADIGVGSSQQKVLLVRVPNYENVTINGNLTGRGFNGNRSGIITFRVHGTLSGSGAIYMNGRGYYGGQGAELEEPNYAKQGNSWRDYGSTSHDANDGGGGNGYSGDTGPSTTGGAGGGYGTEGNDYGVADGGTTYGNQELDQIFFGSGGGGGGRNENQDDNGGRGGNGGGIVIIQANVINFNGPISAKGANGQDNATADVDSDGGGGSGGSVKIAANTLTNLNHVYIFGGANDGSGNGGYGRAAIYCGSLDNCNPPTDYYGYLDYYDNDYIFEDGFETGQLDISSDSWAGTEVAAGSLSVTSDADFAGNYGLEINLGQGVTYNDTQNINIREEHPGGSPEYHVLFYLHPNNIVVGNAGEGQLSRFGVLGSNDTNFAITMEGSSSNYALRLINKGDSEWTISNPVSINNGWNKVAMVYKASTSDGKNNGYTYLYINDILVVSHTGLDNDTLTGINAIYLGASGIDTGSSGSFYIDNYEARRFSSVQGVDVPEGEETTPEATAQPKWLVSNYIYDELHPHAVAEVAREQMNGTTTTDAYTYDANGNMICRVEDNQVWEQVYNAENRLAEVRKKDGGSCASMGSTTASWTFTYDGDGVRTKEVYWDGTTTTTRLLLFGGLVEVENPGVGQEVTKHYSIAGMGVAMDDGTGTYYLATDHLSSTSLVMDASGNIINQQRYMPFGEVRESVGTQLASGADGYTDIGYTGQRNYEDFGLMDYNARFYSTRLGRFTQPDTIIPDLTNSQAWNRYSYTLNNPVKYIDPSGHFSLSSVANAVSNWVSSNQDDIAKVAITVAAVAGTAAVCAASAGIGCVIGAGVIAAASSYSKEVVSNVWEESDETSLFDGSTYNSDTLWNDVDKRQVITDGVIGALGAGIGSQASNLSNSIMKSVCTGGNCRYIIAGVTGFVEGVGVQMASNVIDGDPNTNFDDDLFGAGLKGALFSVIGHGASTGDELSIGNNFRIAPFGNRTNNPYGSIPHYHQRKIDQLGEIIDGEGISKHRPWE